MTKKQTAKFVIPVLVTAMLLLLIVHSVYHSVLNHHDTFLSYPHYTRSTEGADGLDSFDSSAVQAFQPQHAYLHSVDLRFICDVYTGDFDASSYMLEVGLYDSRERLLKQTVVGISDFESWYYFEFIIDRALDVHQTYSLVFRPLVQQDDPSASGALPVVYKLLRNEKLFPDSISTYFNGEKADYEYDIVYTYYAYEWSALIMVCLGSAAVLGLVLLMLLLTRNKKAPLWCGILLLVLLPGLLYVLVETATGNLPSIRPTYLRLNLILILLALLIFALPFRKIKIGTIALTVILLCLAVVEYFLLQFRGRSLTPLDLVNVGTGMQVMGGYQYELSATLALALEWFILLIWLQAVCLNVEWPEHKWSLCVRLIALAAIIATVWFSTQPEKPVYGPWKATLASTDADETAAENEEPEIYIFDFWDFESNYMNKGFLWSMYLQLRFTRVKTPDGYSVSKVQSIAQASEAQYEAASPPSVTPKNILLIMNESLADMSYLGDVKTDEAILPYLNSMDSHTIKGKLQAPTFGNGTAETEYEALTGNTKQFLPLNSTSYMLYCDDPEYGLALTLRAQGYRTVALHPYPATNYHRDKVYPKMGFDEFISIENWGENRPGYRYFMSDDGSYAQLIQVVEESGDEPLFAFLVTLQNHAGYSDASRNGYEGRMELAYDSHYPEAELYLDLANESDQAFKRLIEHFEQVDDPTLIVMFGDHLPSLETDFYYDLLENGEDVIQRQKYYQTPLVIWANYDIPEASDQLISANYLGSAILELAGLKTTPYDRFLLNLSRQLPVIGMGMVMDAQGNWYAMSELPEAYDRLIQDYDIWQYNRIFKRTKLPELYVP